MYMATVNLDNLKSSFRGRPRLNGLITFLKTKHKRTAVIVFRHNVSKMEKTNETIRLPVLESKCKQLVTKCNTLCAHR